jgi:hypothetical protein
MGPALAMLSGGTELTERTISNPVTGERVTFVEPLARALEREPSPTWRSRSGAGLGHSHDAHEERIDVLEGEIEVRSTASGEGSARASTSSSRGARCMHGGTRLRTGLSGSTG